MSAATFLHTGMRAPAPEGRRQELGDLITALDRDDFLTSTERFNALHPTLGNLIEEIEGFKQSKKIPPEGVLAKWRDVGKELGDKGYDYLSQALTHATEAYGHLQAIQNDGDVVGATMGLLGSLQNGFSKSRSNGGFVGGIYQQLNDLSKQISFVYAALSYQIEAANQRNIREHQTTRYNLALMGQEIGTHLKTLQSSSREQGAVMIHSVNKLDDKIAALSQNTGVMLDELALAPLQECLASIRSHRLRSRENVGPTHLMTQIEILERWLHNPPIAAKFNGTFFAKQPGSEQVPFLQSVQPDSPHLVGYLAESLKMPNLENLANLPLMEAILEGYKTAQGQLIECGASYDAEGRLFEAMQKRLTVLEGVVGALKQRDAFAPFFKAQQELLKRAVDQETKAMQAASKSLIDPVHASVQRNLETTFLHAVEQTFDKQPLNPQLTKPLTAGKWEDSNGQFCVNVHSQCDRGVVDTLNRALQRYKGDLLKPLQLPKMELGKERAFAAQAKPSFLHHAILKNGYSAYLREMLLPLEPLHTRSFPLRQALTLEQMGHGSVYVEAQLLNMEVKHRRDYGIDLFRVENFESPLTLQLEFFYTPCQHQRDKILLQQDILSLPSINTDPLHGVYYDWCMSTTMTAWDKEGDGDNGHGWNGDALGCVVAARYQEAVKKKPLSSKANNEAVMEAKFNDALRKRQEEIRSHMTLEATAAKALLDQAKADYSLAVVRTESYSHWLGDKPPVYQTADAFFGGAHKLPDSYAGPMTVLPNPIEEKIKALRSDITTADFALKAKRAQQVEVVNEQKQADEIGQLKAQVVAQAKQIQDLMALVLTQQKRLLQLESKD